MSDTLPRSQLQHGLGGVLPTENRRASSMEESPADEYLTELADVFGPIR